jgi:hypothetical protein
MAYVDFKVTIWERVHFDDADIEKVVEKIKNGIVSSSEDMFTEFEDRVAYDSELLHETAEQMSIEENGNQSTIELLNSDGDTICTNEK